MNYALPLVAPDVGHAGHRPNPIARPHTKEKPATRDELVQLLYNGPFEEQPWRQFLKALLGFAGLRKVELEVSCQGGIILRGKQGEEPHLAAPDLWQHRAEQFFCPVQGGAPDTVRSLVAGSQGGWHAELKLISRGQPRGATIIREVHDLWWAEGLEAHLAQALSIYARMHAERQMTQALGQTLDQMAVGTFILDAAGTILHSNRAAQELINVGLMLKGRDGRLGLPSQTQGPDFNSLVAEVTSGTAGPEGRVMAVEAAGGARFGLLVRKIGKSEGVPITGSPAVAVHVSGSGAVRPIEQHVRALFGLKPYEAELASLLTTGFSLTEAAEKMGLTENTVRTYCKTILSKLGVRRQSELVCTILRSVAVLG